MIPPRNPYMKFVCGACGWSVIHKQHSDVIFVPMQCERCGAEYLKTQAANALEQVAHEAAQLLKKWT
jgi:DNA-directed RNA polymerase subunit RPC12/RpoP